MTPLFRIAGLLIVSLLLLIAVPAMAQVPDTTQRKPALPTGPPAPVEQNKPKQERTQQQPEVQVKPEIGQAQEEERTTFVDRLYFGGSFGLQFGTFTNISLLPIIGYRVTDKFSVGTGVVYHFIRSGGRTLQNYGGRAFAQHEVLPGLINNGAILVHSELEVLNIEDLRIGLNGQLENFRKTVSMPMAGLGYRQRMGERASFDFLVLYNFNDLESPYSNPVIRAGFNIPFRR